jgi:hypothetical protein
VLVLRGSRAVEVSELWSITVFGSCRYTTIDK